MNNVIADTGYMGLSNGILLAQHSEAVCIDIAAEKVAMSNRKASPIEVFNVLAFFKREPDVIITNRWSPDLVDRGQNLHMRFVWS